jgi:hypothetical protein
LYVVDFHKHEDDLKNNLKNTKDKVRSLEASLREVEVGGQELKQVMEETIDSEYVLTPKIGTGKRLICGPNLVANPVRQGKISSGDLIEVPAVGSMFPFGKRTVCAGFAGSRADVARAEGRDEWMDRRSHLGIKLGIKYCARSPPGVVLGQGINMNPGCM